jgi:S-adenosylmethionine:tRNA ribosyltransferase-isomerase
MIAAHEPMQRPQDAKLLVVDAEGRIAHAPRSRFVDFLQPGDLVIANDAATLPASLHGVHSGSGADIEVRLAGPPPLAFHGVGASTRCYQSGFELSSATTGRSSLAPADVTTFSAVVFGAGDFHVRTEARPLPPSLGRGDHLQLGPLSAVVEAVLEHPRLIVLRFAGSSDAVWAGIARHGRPIQYSHVKTPLVLWDVWSPIAGVPAAFEPPSASFAVDWESIRVMRERGIAFATITLAAGISSTGDPELDRVLPFDEPYRIPETTAAAIRHATAQGGRLVAIGTTVVRALEHAAARRGVVCAGDGVADQRIGANSHLRVVDAILSGTHEPDDSHYQVLRAFVDDTTLASASAALETLGYRTHEFGDSVLVERKNRAAVATMHVEHACADRVTTAA